VGRGTEGKSFWEIAFCYLSYYGLRHQQNSILINLESNNLNSSFLSKKVFFLLEIAVVVVIVVAVAVYRKTSEISSFNVNNDERKLKFIQMLFRDRIFVRTTTANILTFKSRETSKVHNNNNNSD